MMGIASDFKVLGIDAKLIKLQQKAIWSSPDYLKNKMTETFEALKKSGDKAPRVLFQSYDRDDVLNGPVELYEKNNQGTYVCAISGQHENGKKEGRWIKDSWHNALNESYIVEMVEEFKNGQCVERETILMDQSRHVEHFDEAGHVIKSESEDKLDTASKKLQFWDNLRSFIGLNKRTKTNAPVIK